MNEESKIDFKHELKLLRWNLLFFGICLAIALAVGLGSWKLKQRAEIQERDAQQSFEQMKTKANRLRNEEQEMRQKIAQYYDLLNRGIIGGEKRLDWVDTLRNIQHDRKLLGLEYEIQPQQVMPASAFATQAPGHDFLASTMQVHIPLLHEEDLIHFLWDLRSRGQAYVRVRECHISRATQTNAPSSTDSDQTQKAQLDSTCQLDWITIREKK